MNLSDVHISRDGEIYNHGVGNTRMRITLSQYDRAIIAIKFNIYPKPKYLVIYSVDDVLTNILYI